ncbi:hypothetical protein Rhe02_44430 [Rhizocola hellebori]|uniref:Uncharacterized protein n=1 Tax=Rhizocola hellebori TaxID=1392758 RepID=A0A8J3Q9F7_9ACTN|nr:hypothetical protein Rhe02_44430 [Rhizocola hellebori]
MMHDVETDVNSAVKKGALWPSPLREMGSISMTVPTVIRHRKATGMIRAGCRHQRRMIPYCRGVMINP